MKTSMMRYGAAILALSTMAGCSSSGGGAATTAATTTSSNPPVVPPPTGGGGGGGTTPTRGTGGTTVASAMDNGTIVLVDNDKTASIDGHRLGGQTAAGGQDLQIRNNFLGGVDISIGGEIFYLKEDDANGDTSSWSQTIADNGTRKQTLTFWNAGKGGREGLFRDEDGQEYHKIVGFHHTDGYGSTKQGHAIIGTPTSARYMDRMSRQVDYTGYYYANVNPTMMTSGTEAAYVTGELNMVADFDEGTVKGTAKNVMVRKPGSLGAIDYGDKMTFDGSISGANIQGEINSTYVGLDGAEVDGAFYGNGAQEAAGVISGTSATGVTEGYFTVYDPKAK